ncbi:divalent-cation tolerance protein CutA [Thermosulfuriphilus sp.]
MEDIVLLYVTASGKDEAVKIGRALVESRLAACINVFEQITSLYWWEGRIEESPEAILIIKTRSELVPQIKERILDLHSYSCPCILVLPVTGGHQPFLDWIRSEIPTGPKEAKDAQ